MKRAIVTYADGAHEELLDIALPTFRTFAERHHYDLVVGNKGDGKLTDRPPAWNKIILMIELLGKYEEVVWFDCDLVVVNPSDDFPPLEGIHGMVRHFENRSEIPNSGVWRVTKPCLPLLENIWGLYVFINHGWWEQAALMTLMGYTVPPEGSDFRDTKCRNVQETYWYKSCQFMRLCWNSHPNYRADRPRIVHCSYPNMQQRIEVMRALVRDPTFDYPRYDNPCKHCMKPIEKDEELLTSK